MKALPFLVTGVSVFAGACVTSPRTPPEVAHIELIGESSPIISVGKSRLEKRDGQLLLTGYVVRLLSANDTTQTHLDVELVAASGAVIRTSIEHFEPRDIPRRHKRPSYASYRVPIEPLPAHTARIVVRAHEGSHS
jgi:hypothetical protein